MASNTSETSKPMSHQRSISLPSRAHPLTKCVEEQLARLRSSSEATSSSASSVCESLGGLKDLYECVDDWLQLSLTQEVLSNQQQRKCVEDLLDGSLRTLDAFGTIQGVLSQMKESIWELESSLRRRGADSVSAKEIDSYLASRKRMKKLVSRSLESLKKMEKQDISNQDSEEETALNILRGVNRMSISVFESVMCFLSRPRTRSSNWSFISKVMSSKRVSGEDANELENLDIELLILKSSRASSVQVNGVQKRVEALESSISEIDEISESIFRCLVKSRVSLLNSLNH